MTDDRRPPRNYLGRGEQRRLFWTWMPLALVLLLVVGWLERTYLRRGDDDPGIEQVDTVVPFAESGVPDAVVIEAAPPEEFDTPAMELGAPARALAAVRDDTVFRDADRDAWFGLWQTLRSTDAKTLRSANATSVSFAELFGQPRAFRGRLVRFDGAVRRLQRVEAPANDYNIDGYWQAWVRADRGPPSPIVVYFLELPEGFQTGLSIDEPVEVVGYFFKRWAYQATDAIRTAPMVVARIPYPRPRSDTSSPMAWIGTFAMITIVGMVAATAVAAWLVNRRSPEPPREMPSDLSETLKGVDSISTEEALGRLAREQSDDERHEDSERSVP